MKVRLHGVVTLLSVLAFLVPSTVRQEGVSLESGVREAVRLQIFGVGCT